MDLWCVEASKHSKSLDHSMDENDAKENEVECNSGPSVSFLSVALASNCDRLLYL